LNEQSKNISNSFFLLILVSIFLVGLSFSDKAYSASVTATVKISVCGNQIAEYGEDCDNSDLKGKSCKKLGYDSGNLTCQADCSFNMRNCKKSSNDNSNESGVNSDIPNTAGQQPSSVVGRIEKDNETRTLEVENNYSDNTENFYALEGEDTKIILVDSQGNNVELTVAVSGNQFVIKQGDDAVASQLSVVVDKDNGKIFILGRGGKMELKVLPGEIFEKIKNDSRRYVVEKMEIGEDGEKIVYIASVKKDEKFLGLFRIKIPLKLKYDAKDGNLIKTEKSLLWNLIDFFSF